MRSHPFDTFISYATEDEALAQKLEAALAVCGFKAWFAPLTLKIGDRLLDSINAGLNLSSTGLLLLSPPYLAKKWTSYELDVLHRQHIENDKRLLALWHGVTKQELDKWNPGISGIVGINTSKISFRNLLTKLVARLSDNAPLRGVAPVWEDPYIRFLRGRGELNVDQVNGVPFNIFEVVLMGDEFFPVFIDGKNYSRAELLFNVAEIMAHRSWGDNMRPSTDTWKSLMKMCIAHGFDPEKMG